MNFTTKEIDLGNGITASEIRYADGIPCGLYYEHECPKGYAPAPSYIPIEGAPTSTGLGPEWKLEQLEPLTLSPSMLCLGCGHHGFVREGKWVSA